MAYKPGQISRQAKKVQVGDEVYFTAEPGNESFSASVAAGPTVRYGSCDFQTLRTIQVRADFADGTLLELTERIGDEEDRTFFAAPAALTRAAVTPKRASYPSSTPARAFG